MAGDGAQPAVSLSCRVNHMDEACTSPRRPSNAYVLEAHSVSNVRMPWCLEHRGWGSRGELFRIVGTGSRVPPVVETLEAAGSAAAEVCRKTCKLCDYRAEFLSLGRRGSRVSFSWVFIIRTQSQLAVAHRPPQGHSAHRTDTTVDTPLTGHRTRGNSTPTAVPTRKSHKPQPRTVHSRHSRVLCLSLDVNLT